MDKSLSQVKQLLRSLSSPVTLAFPPPSTALFLSPGHHVDRGEDDALEAAPEVLLIAKKDLVEVAHAADKNAVVEVELVEAARKFCPGYTK